MRPVVAALRGGWVGPLVSLVVLAVAGSPVACGEAVTDGDGAGRASRAPAGESGRPEDEGTGLTDPSSTTTRLVLLGTGTPTVDPDRLGPAVAVVVGGAAYLVDAGTGVLQRAVEAATIHEIPALMPDRLARAFITHLHSDHTVGYPALILSTWAVGRERRLRILGPEGIEEMTARLIEAYRRDIELRSEGLPAVAETIRVEARAVGAGTVHVDDRVTVDAFPVRHGAWEEAFGYTFRTPDRRIVVSGDTAPADAVVRQCDGCDILLHEVYSHAGWRDRPQEWQRYHATHHTSTRELAGIARRARPDLLVLYHQLFWGSTDEELVAEIREAGYDGEVVSGRDLDVF